MTNLIPILYTDRKREKFYAGKTLKNHIVKIMSSGEIKGKNYFVNLLSWNTMAKRRQFWNGVHYLD